jgi:mannose-6-phosphate isomerase
MATEQGQSSQTAGFSAPIFFERNRVARVYTGGLLFHDFFGDPAEDGFFPEEWVASSVKALNRKPSSDHEGVSIVADSGRRFDELLSEYPEELLGGRTEVGLLVKLLDSAIRLPVQAHPTKEFARIHFGSPHGKTESWLVLDTRPGASIYYGLRDGVTLDDMRKAIRRAESDRNALPSLLNRIPARKGDVYLIPAGVAHAIGAGCLILEVQEPTDFTIQPEVWCGEYRLNDYEMYLGLEEETALECFDFERLVGDRAIAEGRKNPRTVAKSADVHSELLIGPEDTPEFSVTRHRISGKMPLAHGPAVCVVTGGSGVVTGSAAAQRRDVHKGDYFFVPASATRPNGGSAVEGDLELIECLPG